MSDQAGLEESAIPATGPLATEAAALAADNNPYVGPRPFEASDRKKFFGREREARELVGLMLSEREALLYAQSGAGKTSLLKARVIPLLREKYDYRVMDIARVGLALPGSVDPGQVKNIFVFSVLLALAGEQSDPSALLEHTLLSYLTLRLAEDQAANTAEGEGAPQTPAVTSRRRKDPYYLLVFDQFEEIFTSHRERWEETAGFFEQVRAALDGLPRLGMLFAMREDHIAELDPYLDCFTHRLRARYRLELLGRQGALEAIRMPAEAANRPFDEDAASHLVDDLSRIKNRARPGHESEAQPVLGQTIEPVQLQVVCSELWKKLPEDCERITQAEVSAYANVDQALTDFYNGAINQVVTRVDLQERVLRRWFRDRLITVYGTRGLVARGEGETEGMPNTAIEILENLHLIRGEARAGGHWYEISHDRLVEPILASNRRWEANRETPLQLAARQWKETQDASLLYSGSALQNAFTWAEASPAEVKPDDLAFIKESQRVENETIERTNRELEETRRRRRLRTLQILVGTVIAFALIAAYALYQANAARIQAGLAQQAEMKAVTEQFLAVQQKALAEQQKATAVAASQVAAEQRAIAEAASAEAEARRAEAQAASAEAVAASLKAQEAEAKTREQKEVTDVLLLSAQASDFLNRRPDWLERAALLAAESQKRYPSATGSQALSEALRLLPDRIAKIPLAAGGDRLSGVMFTPDGKLLLMAHSVGPVQIWDTKTWQKVGTLGDAPAKLLAISNNSEQAFMVDSEGKNPRIFSISKRSLVKSLDLKDVFYQASFSPNGTWLLTQSETGLRVWIVSGGIKEFHYDMSGYVQSSVEYGAVSGDRLIGFLGKNQRDKTVLTIWDWKNYKVAYQITDVMNNSKAAFSPTLFNMAAQLSDGSLVVLLPADRQLALRLGRPDSIVSAAEISPDGKWLLMGFESGETHLWDIKTGEEKIVLHHLKSVTGAAFSPDSATAFSTGADGTIWMIDTQTGIKTSMITLDDANAPTAVSNQGLLASGGNDGVSIWKMNREGQAKTSFQLPDNRRVNQMKVDTAGKLGLVLDDKQQLWMVDLVEGKVLNAVGVARAKYSINALSPDGLKVATGDDRGYIQVWNADGTALVKIETPLAPGFSPIFSQDSRWLISMDKDKTTRVWDATTGEPMGIDLPALVQMAQPVGIAPDASWVALMTLDGAIHLVDPGTGKEQSSVPGQAALSSASASATALSVDGNYLAAARENGLIRLVHLDDGQAWVLAGHENKIVSMMFSADGRWLFSSSLDGTARVWDVTTGLPSAVITLDEPVYGGFGPDGSTLVVANPSGSIKNLLWQPDDLVDLVCQRLPRNLTQDEWLQYLPGKVYAKTCPNLP